MYVLLKVYYNYKKEKHSPISPHDLPEVPHKLINKATSAWTRDVAFASANEEDGNGNHAVTAAASFPFKKKKRKTAAASDVALAKATSPDLHRGAPGRWGICSVLD
jgi:hypothetical protein